MEVTEEPALEQWTNGILGTNLYDYYGMDQNNTENTTKAMTTILKNWFNKGNEEEEEEEEEQKEEFFKDLVGKAQFCIQMANRPFADPRKKGEYQMFVDSANTGSVLMKHNRTADGICSRNDITLAEAFQKFHTKQAEDWGNDIKLIEIKGAKRSDSLYTFGYSFRTHNPYRDHTCLIAALRWHDEQWKYTPYDEDGKCIGINESGQWICPCYLAFIPVTNLENLMELWFDVHHDTNPKSITLNPTHEKANSFTQVLSRCFRFIQYGDTKFCQENVYNAIFAGKDEFQSITSFGIAQRNMIEARVKQYETSLEKGTKTDKAIKTAVHVLNMIEFYENPGKFSNITRTKPFATKMKQAAEKMRKIRG